MSAQHIEVDYHLQDKKLFKKTYMFASQYSYSNCQILIRCPYIDIKLDSHFQKIYFNRVIHFREILYTKVMVR